MTVVNVMWSSGPAFLSVHKVHDQILSAVAEEDVQLWLLRGKGQEHCVFQKNVRAWELPLRLLKGRRAWYWLQGLVRWRMRRALRECLAQRVLLDGIGAARVLLPVLQSLPEVQGVVVFHGETQLRSQDIKLLRSLPPAKLSLIAVSDSLASSMEAQIGVPVLALRVSLNPLLFRNALLSTQAARQKLGIESNVRVLGAVGRLVRGKGFKTVIEAFSVLALEWDNLRLIIVGEGEQRRALEEFIFQCGLSEKVFLLGHLDDMATLYRGFDWVVIPSFAEGLGLVLQEAVMAGVPVISSDIPVFHEQLGDTAIYAAVGDANDWQLKLRQCLELDAAQVAQRQAQHLNPERDWQEFTSECRALFLKE